MKLNNLTKTLRRVWNKSKSTIISHGPQILAGIGAGCFVAATVCAVKETPEAMETLKKKEELDPDISVLQKAAVVAPKYKKTLVFTGLGLGFTCGAWKLEAKQMAELAATASVALSDNSKLKEALKEQVGEQKATEITDKINEEKGVTTIKNGDDPEIIIPAGKKQEIFRIDCTGKSFISCKNDVEEGLCDCRSQLNTTGILCLNDIYGEFGIGNCSLNDGWMFTNNLTSDVRTEFSWELRPFKDDQGRLGWNIVFTKDPVTIDVY